MNQYALSLLVFTQKLSEGEIHGIADDATTQAAAWDLFLKGLIRIDARNHVIKWQSPQKGLTFDLATNRLKVIA